MPVAAPFFFFWRHKNDVTFNLIKFHLKGAVGREQGEGSLYDINLKFALGIVTEAKEYSQKKKRQKGKRAQGKPLWAALVWLTVMCEIHFTFTPEDVQVVLVQRLVQNDQTDLIFPFKNIMEGQ